MSDVTRAEYDALMREFERIGHTPDGLAIAAGSLPALMERLRDVPAGAGREALDTLFADQPRSEPPAWTVWPNAGDLFTRDEFYNAFIVHNASPEHLVEYYSDLTRPLDAHALAFLWHVSPEVGAKVDKFLDQVGDQWRRAGMPIADIEKAESLYRENWESARRTVEQTRREQVGQFGPAVVFRFGPELNQAEASEQYDAVMRAVRSGFADEGGWLLERTAEGTSGGIRLAYGTSEKDVAAAVDVVARNSVAQNVHSTPGQERWPEE